MSEFQINHDECSFLFLQKPLSECYHILFGTTVLKVCKAVPVYIHDQDHSLLSQLRDWNGCADQTMSLIVCYRPNI